MVETTTGFYPVIGNEECKSRSIEDIDLGKHNKLTDRQEKEIMHFHNNSSQQIKTVGKHDSVLFDS